VITELGVVDEPIDSAIVAVIELSIDKEREELIGSQVMILPGLESALVSTKHPVELHLLKFI